MDRDFENDFEVLFENNSTTNYLVLRAKENINVLNYQVQMLLNNKIKGLLDFNINYIGGELNCFYNVTSKCTLASFMSRKKFTRDEFLVMLLNIMNNICHIKNYLLYDYNILLDERYIYVQPEKMEIFFVYLPFNRSKNDYKTFLLKLVVEMARFCAEDSDNYLQRILEFIRNDLFSLGTLKTQLEILLGSDIKSIEANQNACFDNKKSLCGFNASDIRVENSMRELSGKFSGKFSDEFSDKFSDKYTGKFASKFTEKRFISDGDDKNHEKKAVREKFEKTVKEPLQGADIKSKSVKIPAIPLTGEYTDKTRLPNRKGSNRQNFVNKPKKPRLSLKPGGVKNLPALGFILFQPVLLILYILTVTSGFVDAGGKKLETAIIPLVIFACIDVLVFRLSRDRLKADKGDSVENVKNGEKAHKVDTDAGVVSFITGKMRAGSQEQQAIIAEQENIKKQIPAPQPVYHGETEIIRKPKIKARAYLKELEGETVIELDKKSILVGRMEGFVDTVLKSSAVGKIHAELLSEEGDYFIVDCNSRNGTFINGKRLVSNTRIKVQNNDMVRFANKEFKFFSSALPGEVVI